MGHCAGQAALNQAKCAQVRTLTMARAIVDACFWPRLTWVKFDLLSSA
jgi:hypothetical protein